MINIQKLTSELKNAGIPVHGVSSDGRIDYNDATDEQVVLGETIKKNHSPLWYREQRLSEYPAISDQLDMIYWDAINGTSLWRDKITEIKTKYPKN